MGKKAKIKDPGKAKQDTSGHAVWCNFGITSLAFKSTFLSMFVGEEKTHLLLVIGFILKGFV